VRSALARTVLDGRPRWAAFERPRAVLRADHLHEVVPVLEAAEAAALASRWVVGMIAYDAGPALDGAVRARRHPAVPLACFGVFDEARPVDGPAGDRYALGPWSTSWSAAEHARAVARVRAHLADGDAYQVNLTFRLRAELAGDPAGLFAALVAAQPTDHGCYLDLGDAAVCCASPERFLRRSGDRVESRPMKGTRPRGDDPGADERVVADLVASAKDRAENLMIVDMVRNDLGRVADTGSVVVPELFVVEGHPTVHQLVSSVTARTSAPLAALVAATFPAASITGAPKVAATGIIADLEPDARGAYTGAVGVIHPGGDLDWAVAIRTAWVDAAAGTVEYGVGGGIVWDSTPEAEWGEALQKGRLVLDLSSAPAGAPPAR
jgi:para-aminobenzoate synthetase/4-amino-4-deoxychorismate lyase